MKDQSTCSLPSRARTSTRSAKRQRQGGRSTLGWTLALATLAAGAWLLTSLLDLPEKRQAAEPDPSLSEDANTNAARSAGLRPPPSLRHPYSYNAPEDDSAEPWRGNAAAGRAPVDEGILLSISGRVLDTAGHPVIGAAVRARAERLFADRLPAGARRSAAAYTGADGAYMLTDLPDGQYRISAEVAGSARAEITARTGAHNADLLLQEEKAMWVYGQLTGQGGHALQGARVTVNLSPPLSVSTDAQGWYEVPVRLPERVTSLDVRFEHPRHVAQSRRLDEGQWAETGEAELNVALEPISRTTTVVGRLESTTGEAIAGEALSLYSPSVMRRSEGMSGKDGTFSIPDVAVATDYMVSVRPRAYYQDLTMRGVRVSEGTELSIPLVPLETGLLVGRMVDVDGRPVPNFTLAVYSTAARSRTLPVTGDEQGLFAVPDVPFGQLVFRSHALPFFRITDAVLNPWTQALTIVLDLGPHEVEGRVLDEEGFPLAAREVSLSWTQTRGGVRSTAIRRTLADADGYFWFSGLGPGPHLISVQAPGFQTARMEQDVGAGTHEIVVTLARNREPVTTAWTSNGAR